MSQPYDEWERKAFMKQRLACLKVMWQERDGPMSSTQSRAMGRAQWRKERMQRDEVGEGGWGHPASGSEVHGKKFGFYTTWIETGLDWNSQECSMIGFTFQEDWHGCLGSMDWKGKSGSRGAKDGLLQWPREKWRKPGPKCLPPSLHFIQYLP